MSIFETKKQMLKVITDRRRGSGGMELFCKLAELLKTPDEIHSPQQSYIDLKDQITQVVSLKPVSKEKS